MTLNCMIVDDEPLATSLLEGYVKNTSFLQLGGTYNSAVDALRHIKEERPHLVFLDIQMPELSGTEFAKIIPPETKIIFTTAFNQYAIDGYKVNAIDYLLKPISYENFLASVSRAEHIIKNELQRNAVNNDRFIYVKSEYKLIQIKFDEILFIEGEKDYVKFYLENEDKPIQSLMNMKKLESLLPKNEFMRIHRSYIIHLRKVKMIDRMRFVIGDRCLPISESYKNEVHQYLNYHTMG